MRSPDDATPPRIELRNPASQEVDLLRQLQRILLTHPVAAQAAFSALVAEGRRFAATDEGKVWHERLKGSAVLRELRLVFDLSTLGLLEEETGAVLPSTYLDALFMIASGGDADVILNRAFWSGPDERTTGGNAGD
jgi:hypothetical protein